MPPPLSPGQSTFVSLSFTAVISADTSSFDQTSYQSNLASVIGTAASDITLSVAAASISVTATARFAAMASAVAAQATLSNITSQGTAAASALLGVPVVSIDSPAVTSGVLPAPSPPPSPPPPFAASAPTELLSARLDSTGSSIFVEFDARPTNRAGMTEGTGSCALIFDSATIVAMQGGSSTAPLCRWTTSYIVQAMLNRQSSLWAGSTVSVLPSTVHPAEVNDVPLTGCTLLGANFCASGSVTAELPDVPATPTASLSMPTSVGPCDDVTIDGLASDGGGVYPLVFRWNASAVDDTLSPQQARAVRSHAQTSCAVQPRTPRPFPELSALPKLSATHS